MLLFLFCFLFFLVSRSRGLLFGTLCSCTSVLLSYPNSNKHLKKKSTCSSTVVSTCTSVRLVYVLRLDQEYITPLCTLGRMCRIGLESDDVKRARE